jgi:hypothetical protein
MTTEGDSRTVEGTCWVACFDLLGFKRKVCAYAQHQYGDGTDGLSVLAGVYIEKALVVLDEAVASQCRSQRAKLYHAHFSDTFVLYASDESRDSFWTVEIAAQSFFRTMITEGVPLRGAVTCGRFYADTEKSILVGPAMIEAYGWAESQDWIGYILTPAATKRLSTMDPPIRLPSLDYAEYDVPLKCREATTSDGGVTPIRREPLFAFRASKDSWIRDCICEMQREAEVEMEGGCQSKYENTLAFLTSTKLIDPFERQISPVGCGGQAQVEAQSGRGDERGKR